MTTAVVTGIVIPLFGLLIWWLKKYLSEPVTTVKREQQYEQELHNAIGKSDSRSINDFMSRRLSELRGARRGQGDSSSSKK
jgi:hypothetical protein